MRLIDADALLKDARQDKALSACLGDIVDVELLVDDQPTIDAVPVVRCDSEQYRRGFNDGIMAAASELVHCRDCVYMLEAKVNTKGFLICPASGMEITDDDFCSYGERRNDD